MDPIREVIETLREIAKANMPGAHEFVYHDAINYKLHEASNRWICYITAHKNYVRLEFYFGANLSDPQKLLQGTGRRMRHVKIKTAEEARADEVAELIRQAWAEAQPIPADSPNENGLF
ncbi:DUF1801 domain-containing protein [Cohnella candidum]|nr:DUF1801 domain-containing protein [Cohnella candidum]